MNIVVNTKIMSKRVKFKLNKLFDSYVYLITFHIIFNFFVVNVCCDNTTETTDRLRVTTTAIDTNSNNEKSSLIFKCPEKFGYYPDNKDCSKYYVCVFGDALHESCTGGLYFSAELQTCDWPRNVECALDLMDDRNKYSVDGVNDGFNENMDHNIDSDELYDSRNNRKVENNFKNNNNNNNENISDEEEENEDIDESEEQISDESEEDQLNQSRDEMDSNINQNNNNNNNKSSSIELSFENNYDNDFDDESDVQNGTDIYANKPTDIQRNKVRNVLIDTTDGDTIFNGQVIGRSADAFQRYGLGVSNDKVKDIHGNKVNIEVDPQQPSYDEAITSIVDEMGGIHIHDGPGGTYALPDKNQLNRYDPLINYNDKDLGFIERITADRRPIVKVTRVRKRLRTDSEDSIDSNNDNKNSYNNEKNFKNQYIPLIVMEREESDSKEEKIRRHRSDNNFKNIDEDSLSSAEVSSHYQNQKRQQQLHFREQNKPVVTLNEAIPIVVPKPDFNKSLELRGFVTTRNDGKVITIPIFTDMANVDSLQNTRRKRVRVVHRLVNRQEQGLEDIPIIVDTNKAKRNPQSNPQKSSQSRQNLLPRILVPDKNRWQPHLPFYGPSLSQIKKVRILPPTGPIPVLKEEPKPELLAVFRPKPKPKLTQYLVENNDNSRNAFDIFEKRVSKPEVTTRPSIRTNNRPKQTNKRPKNKQKSVRNQVSNKTSTVETTTQPFIEISLDHSMDQLKKNGSQSRGQSRNSDQLRIKLSRNGKILGSKEDSTQTTPTPIRITPSKNVRQSERLVLRNNGEQPLNNFDYYDLPYFENSSNQTISYLSLNEELSQITTISPKTTTKKPKQSRPKKGSSSPASRPTPIYPTPKLLSTATKCTTSKCRLPDCFCGGTAIPNGMSSGDIPQMIMITFDDSINDLNWEIYEEIFTARNNPNGCPILGTFYVSHEWTDYGQVQSLYSNGHEMASHSITHSFGEKFSVQKWNKEVNGQREILHLYGGVNLADVRGMRAPFLQGGGNKQFEMLYESNFTYDSTMPVFENSPPFWPYTLDYVLNHECMIAPCPTKSFPGVWEVGMVMWQDLKGGRCSMGDACSNPSDEEGIYKMLLKNFNRHYQSNRAPFGLYYHSAWFNTPHHRKGFMTFIDEMLTKKDVYFVTKYQMIQWIRNPTPLSSIESFMPWNCNYEDRPPPCKNPTVCNVGSKSGSRFLKTCQPCPASYPWVGNTGFISTKL